MKTMFAVLAVLLCAPSYAVAQVPDAAPPARAQPQPAALAPSAAPSIQLTVEQLQALVANASASIPMQPVKTAVVSPEGIFGFSWATMAGWLGGLGALLFGLWKTSSGAKVRKLVEDSIAAAWWVAERNGQDYDGVVKASMAMKALYESLAQQGIPLDPKVGAQATAKWKAMAAQDGIERPRFDGEIRTPAPAPADIAAALAKLTEKRDVADAAKTATDIANEAAK